MQWYIITAHLIQVKECYKIFRYTVVFILRREYLEAPMVRAIAFQVINARLDQNGTAVQRYVRRTELFALFISLVQGLWHR